MTQSDYPEYQIPDYEPILGRLKTLLRERVEND